MNRRFVRTLTLGALTLTALLLIWHMDLLSTQEADAAVRYRTAPNLFYNYYVPPGGSPGVGAQLYVAPLPTPPLVGHTWVTYEPLMPHEFLWRHCRKYQRCHPNGSVTRTKVVWE